MTRLLIDAGQTSIRARLIVATAVNDRILPPLRTSENVPAQIVHAVRTVLAGRREEVTVACAVSGLTDAGALVARVLSECADLGVRRVVAAHDSIAGYLGCVGDAEGAVVAVGTGVVTLAVGHGASARVDGWGNIMGDAGSGYWIGRAGLEAAMRAHDGRAPATVLLDVLRNDFTDVENAYIAIQADPDRIGRVAGYARTVLDAADSDPVCAQIVRNAADELCCSLTAGLLRTGWQAEDSPTISWTGGIMFNDTISAELTCLVQAAWPACSLIPPRGEPIDGVAMLPDLDSSHPLFAAVASMTAHSDHTTAERTSQVNV